MIPKIIHFCWLSKDEYPTIVKKCIASWKKVLPDYEFMLWDTNKFDINTTLWTKQAFETKKYAFAADYIRLHALYTYGGIYLDTDVEVLKKLDNLLTLPYFVGNQFDNLIEAAIIGAKKEADWVLNCLKFYENRPFILENGKPDLFILPEILQYQIKESREIKTLDCKDLNSISEKIRTHTNSFFVFPSEYFSPKNHQTGKLTLSHNTYTIHHYNNSWLPFKSKIRLIFVKLIGLDTLEKTIGFFHIRKLAKIVSKN